MKKRAEVQPLIFAVSVVIAIIIILCANPVYFVQSGQKAVIKRFGVVQQKVINEGMNFKVPFIDSVTTVTVTPQNVQNEVNTYTKDNQPIDVVYNVIYVKPKDDIANTVIRYQSKPYEVFASTKINDTFKAVAGKYTASEFVTKREIIRKDFLEQAKLAVVNSEDGKQVIDILDTPIPNITFDAEYTTAIKEKQVAQQKAQKAEYVLQQAKIDAQAAVAKAEGEAKALTVKAQAISKSPSVVRLKEIEKWDGHFPLNAKTIMDGAATQALVGTDLK